MTSAGGGPRCARDSAAAVPRQVAIRAVGLGPHRRHDQSALGEEIRLLDQSTKLADTPEAWLDGREAARGIMVDNWHAWINASPGRAVPARVPGKGKLKVIEAAPGTYARIRADKK